MVSLHKRIILFLIFSLLSIGFFLFLTHSFRTQKSKASSESDVNIYTPHLKQHKVEVSAELTNTKERTDALIYLQSPQLNIKVKSTNSVLKAKERKEFVNQLKQATNIIQQKVLFSLRDLQDNKKIKIKKTFFVDNIIYAEIDSDVINTLINTPGVVKIIPNYQIELPPMTNSINSTPEWNLSKIGADRVWNELGINGQGVVVANIDTGVQWDHPALKNKYRGFDGVNINNDYNWYDPSNTSPIMPMDNIGHGTHVMGTIVGSENENQIGVAPGAKWIAAKGCASSVCSTVDLIAAGQWMLAPTKIDGTEPDATKAPDVINNSWGGTRCNNFYQGVVQSWRNVGIVPVFSAGNKGPNSDTVGSPGEYPESISVGAVDSSNVIASFSSRGPSCYLFGTKIKPEVVAPGVSIRSSIPTDGYMSLDGTSMAAPHVTGLIALLLQKKPTLNIYEIETILKKTAIDLGIVGNDNSYGMGLINSYQAVKNVDEPIPSPTPTSPLKSLNIIYPNGSEIFSEGETIRITWDSTSISNVYIDLLSSTGSMWGISWPITIPNLGYYDWVVQKLGNTTDYKIIVSENTGTIRDSSDGFFTIIEAPSPTPIFTLTPTLTNIPFPTMTPTPTFMETPTLTRTLTPTRTPTPTQKPSRIDIYAYGTRSDSEVTSELYPTMELRLNGILLKKWINVKPSSTGGFNKYSYLFSRKIIPTDKIRIYFTNDDNKQGAFGKNLRVDKIVVDGKTFQTEATNVYSTGTWLPEAGVCKPRYAFSEWLNCNGSFLFPSIQ